MRGFINLKIFLIKIWTEQKAEYKTFFLLPFWLLYEDPLTLPY